MGWLQDCGGMIALIAFWAVCMALAHVAGPLLGG